MTPAIITVTFADLAVKFADAGQQEASEFAAQETGSVSWYAMTDVRNEWEGILNGLRQHEKSLKLGIGAKDKPRYDAQKKMQRAALIASGL